jgi:signal peptidase I
MEPESPPPLAQVARPEPRRVRCRHCLTAILFASVFLAVGLRYTTYDSVVVVGQSMEPTLETGDRLFANRRAYDHHPPGRGDVVVINPPDEHSTEIKRVIGLPGDWVFCFGGGLYINGARMADDYIAEPMIPETMPFPVLVPEDHVFVMGDNRNYSRDSRDFGPVAFDEIRGRADLVFSPVTRWSRLKAPPELRALLPPAKGSEAPDPLPAPAT